MADISTLGKPGVFAGKLPPLVKRFYLQFALVPALVLAIIADDAKFWSPWSLGGKVLALVILAFFVTIACRLFADSREWNNPRYLALSAGALALLALPLFLGNTIELSWEFPTLPLLCAGIALLVLTAPFLRRDHANEALWEYNRATGAGVISGLAMTIIMGFGLFLPIVLMTAIGTGFTPKFLFIPFLICMSFVAVWQLLAGVPRRFDATPGDPAPRFLSRLANIVIAPLLAAGLAILLFFLVRFFATTKLLGGNDGWVIAGFAIFVVAAHFVSWPLRETGGRAVRLFHEHYRYALLAPAIVLTLDAGMRVADSGLTEGRYLMLMLAFWLCATAIYHSLPTQRRLVVAPAMLAALLFFASFGPWGATGLTTRLHLSQLEKQLTANGLLVEGKIVPAEAFIEREKMESITTTLDLFSGDDQWKALRTLFTDHGHNIRSFTFTRIIMYSIGLQSVSPGDLPSFRFDGSREDLFDVEGFSYMAPAEWNSASAPAIIELVAVSGTKFDSELNRDEGTLVVRGGGGERVVFDLIALVQRVKQGIADWNINFRNYNSGKPPITVEATSESGRLTARLHIHSIGGGFVDGVPEIKYLAATILLRENQTPR